MMLLVIFLRSLIFSIIMITMSVVFGGLSYFIWFLPKNKLYQFNRSYCFIMTSISKHLCKINYTVTGKANIPKDRLFVIFCKHQSTWETFFLNTIVEKYCPIVKAELLRIPFFGRGLANQDPIGIDRKKRQSAMGQLIKQGKLRIDAGYNILCFPEGTRTAPGATPNYQVGGAKLAEAVNVPILPIALNSGRCWPKKGFLKKPGTISVVIGPVIETENKKARTILAEAENWIETAMDKL